MHLRYSGLLCYHHHLSHPTLPPNRTPSSHPVHHPFAELITPVLHLHSHLNHHIKNTSWPFLTSLIHPLPTTSPPRPAYLQVNGHNRSLRQPHGQRTQSPLTPLKHYQNNNTGTHTQHILASHTGRCTVAHCTLPSHTHKAIPGSPPFWISIEHTEPYMAIRPPTERKLIHRPSFLPHHRHLPPRGQGRKPRSVTLTTSH